MPRFFSSAILFFHRFRRLSRIKRILLSLSVLAASFIAGSVLLFSSVWLGLLGHVPDDQELLKLEHPLATEVYSADSVLLGKYYFEERSDIAYEKIPAHVVDALLATEDARFFEHNGIDYQSLGRVF